MAPPRVDGCRFECCLIGCASARRLRLGWRRHGVLVRPCAGGALRGRCPRLSRGGRRSALAVGLHSWPPGAESPEVIDPTAPYLVGFPAGIDARAVATAGRPIPRSCSCGLRRGGARWRRRDYGLRRAIAALRRRRSRPDRTSRRAPPTIAFPRTDRPACLPGTTASDGEQSRHAGRARDRSARKRITPRKGITPHRRRGRLLLRFPPAGVARSQRPHLDRCVRQPPSVQAAGSVVDADRLCLGRSLILHASSRALHSATCRAAATRGLALCRAPVGGPAGAPALTCGPRRKHQLSEVA